MVDDQPLAVALFVHEGVAGLHVALVAGLVGQREGVHAGIHGAVVIEHAHGAVIDHALRLLGQEHLEVVFDLFARGAHFVGDRRQQHAVRCVQIGHLVRVAGGQRRIPGVEQRSDFALFAAGRQLGLVGVMHHAASQRRGGSQSQNQREECATHGESPCDRLALAPATPAPRSTRSAPLTANASHLNGHNTLYSNVRPHAALRGPAVTWHLQPPMRQRWTPSIALRYRTAAVAMANQACDRTMATISTPRSSSTPTGTTSKRWSPASRHAQRQHRDPRPAWRWLEARTRGTLTAQ